MAGTPTVQALTAFLDSVNLEALVQEAELEKTGFLEDQIEMSESLTFLIHLALIVSR